MIRFKIKTPDGILLARRRAAQEADELWGTAGPGALGFIENERFRDAFCARCAAAGDPDDCPTGLCLVDEQCWRIVELRDLLKNLTGIEYEYAGNYWTPFRFRPEGGVCCGDED